LQIPPHLKRSKLLR